MSIETDLRGAGVRFPPPVILLLSLLFSYFLNRIAPLGLGGSSLVFIAGAVALAGALLLLAVSANLFRRSKTHIEPWKPTSTIISSGIYAYSRNPIYLSFCVLMAGIALMSDNLWMLLSVLPLGLLLYYVAIRKEEAYLESKFGEDYLGYKRRVRRWL